MTASRQSLTLPRSYREPLWMRMLIIASLLVGAFHVPAVGLREVLAAAPCVQRSGPSYTVSVCITTPADGATVSGDVPFSASVTAVSGTMPAIERVKWYFSSQSSSSMSTLASDYASPYTLQLPTYRWADGSYRLDATVEFADDYTTPINDPARVWMTLANGVSKAPSSNGSWTPKPGGSNLNIVAVGDGAGGLPGATDVGNLAQSLGPSQFLYLGDVYNSGTYTEFYNYYGPTLGPLAAVTNPVPGNHESGNSFRGYRDYWNLPSTPYYSYDAGGWHFIALDSTTQFGQTAAGTAQYNWLAQDLQANAGTSCTLAFFHHPRFGLTSSAGNAHMQDIWSLLATSGVDVVVTGHEHNYQRWQPMDSNGNVVNNGMIQYVAGTGGHEQIPFGRSDSRVASRIARVDGVLQLTLGAGGGSSRFISTSGSTSDQASFNCHDGEGGGTDTQAPTAPANLTATAPSGTKVDLSWSAATDNIGVTGYDIYRDGTKLTTLGPVTTYTDSAVAAETTYRYTVQARDAAGNVSPASNEATVTTPAQPPTSDVQFGISADARVRENFPTANYGTSTLLQADGGIDPEVETYLKVEVTGVTAAPVQAKLRLYVRDTTYAGSTDGPAIYLATDSTWSETGITWDNRPGRTTTSLDDLGAVTAGTWVEYDVTSAITVNGTYTFVLAASTNDATDFASRETATPPQLVLSVADAPAAARIAAVEAESTPASMSPQEAELAQTTDAAATPAQEGARLAEPIEVASPTTDPAAISTPTTTPDSIPTMEEVAANVQIGTVVNTGGQKLHCRIGPAATGQVLTSLAPGDQVVVRSPVENGWVPVICGGQDGYVSADYLEITTQPATAPTSTDIAPVVTAAATEEAVNPTVAADSETVPTTSPTEPAPAELPTEDVIEPTPIPVINGWQDDPQIPWWWLTDRDPDTLWTAYLIDSDDTAEVGFDIGYIAPIDRLSWHITWPMQGLVEIQLSNDGVNWYRLTIIDLELQRADEWHDIPVNSQARFVNFLFTDPYGRGAVGAIREVEIWAAPSGYADPIDYLPFVTPTPMPQPTMEPTAVPVAPTEAPPEPVVVPTEEPVMAPPPPPPTEEPQPEPVELPPPTDVVETLPPTVEPSVLPEPEGAPGGG